MQKKNKKKKKIDKGKITVFIGYFAIVSFFIWLVIMYTFPVLSYIYNFPFNFDKFMICSWLFFAVIVILFFHYYDPTYLTQDNFVHSLKYDFKFNNFADFNDFMNYKFRYMGYDEPSEIALNGDKEKIYIYLKREGNNNFKIWVIIDAISITSSKWDSISLKVEEWFEKTFGDDIIKVKRPKLIISVKEYTNFFEAIVKDTYSPFDDNMTVGLLLPKKKFYIPNSKEIRAEHNENYQKNLKEFLEMIEEEQVKQ